MWGISVATGALLTSYQWRLLPRCSTACAGRGRQQKVMAAVTAHRGSFATTARSCAALRAQVHLLAQATSWDCLCLEGHYSLQSDSGFSCEPCQAGRYKPATANQQICPSQCPTNSDSPNASTSLSNCSCIAGFYAELDEAGLLVRCASCNSFTHLSCFGGFYEQTDRHRLPVARPGYFQTAPTTAIKCNVVMDDGISACLGGGLCAEGSETLECMGRYSNACAEGSTGFLCGECPPGWARNYWKEPCRLCTASWPLIFSVLLDVGTKVFLNFVVTSLAATAAVRGSGKLHAIMIRIATQWLAACSVVATLDLDQMSPLQMRDLDGPEGEVGLFAWPVEVTVAMLRLFEFLTLTPVLTTVDLDAQCFSQEFSQNPAAPRIALGIYYLSLPLLVMLGSVLLSWAAVRLLVPLANRIGFSFSEAGRRRQKRDQGFGAVASGHPTRASPCPSRPVLGGPRGLGGTLSPLSRAGDCCRRARRLFAPGGGGLPIFASSRLHATRQGHRG